MDVLFGWSYKRFVHSIVVSPAKSNDSRWHSYDIAENIHNLKGNCPLWHHAWLGKWIPDLWINRNHGMEVVFQGWKVLMSLTFHRQYFLGHNFFYSSSFSAVCKAIFFNQYSWKLIKPIHLWIFSLSLTSKLFSVVCLCQQNDFLDHFCQWACQFTSAAALPGLLVRLSTYWKEIEWYWHGHLANIELRKQQKVLVIRVFFSFSCLCAKNVGWFRFLV